MTISGYTRAVRLAFASLTLIVALSLAFLEVPQAVAKAPECKELGVALSFGKDPTDLVNDPVAVLTANGGKPVVKPRVVLRRGNRVFANGSLAGRLPRGRPTSIPLHLRKAPGAGRYKVQLTARKGGCRHRTAIDRIWRFDKPSLPVRAAAFSTLTGDNAGAVRLILRPVGNADVGQVRVSLKNSAGAVVAEQSVTELDGGQTVVALPLATGLKAGKYRIHLVGRQAGSQTWQSATQEIVFAKGGGEAKPVPVSGVNTQKVVVDWYNGKWSGRELGGFVAPGIGYGEIVCRPDAQWIRFYPSNEGNEVAMMNWTYKDWGQYQEKALREALHTAGTGLDFNEGFNKFSPSEKTSTGEFDGIISDRGPIGGPGGGALAAPTTLQLTWQWDFSSAKTSRCHVEGVFKTQTADEQPPLARSVQVVWRGDANASGNTVSSTDFPGLGEVNVTCEPGQGGARRLTVNSPAGAKIITREGSEDSTLPQSEGPVVVGLPNNGMVVVEMNSGQRIVVSSRWKTNDPSPSRNWCSIAAQILSG